MKKWMGCVLALCLMLGCAVGETEVPQASAEVVAAQETVAPAGEQAAPAQMETQPAMPEQVTLELEPGEPEDIGAPPEGLWLDLAALCGETDRTALQLAYDLNGDGVDEEMTIETDEERYVTDVAFLGGSSFEDTVDTYLFDMQVYVGDADALDGCLEVYLFGDMASNDYETLVYRVHEDGSVAKGRLEGYPIDTDGYGHVTMAQVVDVMGTYGCSDVYRLEEQDGVLSFVRESGFTVQYPGEEWHTLVTVLPLTDVTVCHPAGEGEDGMESMVEGSLTTLPAGTRLWLWYTDGETVAYVRDDEERFYRVALTVEGLTDGWLVNGISENRLFETVPYAG